MIAGIAVLWAGYTLAWWGWLGMTDQVPKGKPGMIWWPSIMDLVIPGNAANLSNTVRKSEKQQAQSTAATQAQGNGPLTGVPANPNDPQVNPVEPAGMTTSPKITLA